MDAALDSVVFRVIVWLASSLNGPNFSKNIFPLDVLGITTARLGTPVSFEQIQTSLDNLADVGFILPSQTTLNPAYNLNPFLGACAFCVWQKVYKGKPGCIFTV